MANQESKTMVINKDDKFKIRWNFTTDKGEPVNRTCTVFFTGVTLPSEHGISYEICNVNSGNCTDLTAEELSSMYVVTSSADSLKFQLPA